MEMESRLPSMSRGAGERDAVRALQRQINQVLFDFSRDRQNFGWSQNGFCSRAGDIVETETSTQTNAGLPGAEKKGICFTQFGGALTAKAEKKSEKSENGTDYRLSERGYGMFEPAWSFR